MFGLVGRSRTRRLLLHSFWGRGVSDESKKEGGEGDIPGLVCVKDSGVQDTVELEGDIVGCDGGLGGDLDGDFLEGLDVGDPVDKRYQDCQAGLEDSIELAHALDDPGGLLGDEADDCVHWEGSSLLEVCWGKATAEAAARWETAWRCVSEGISGGCREWSGLVLGAENW